MSTALIIYPHQLFAAHPGLAHQPDVCVLVEDDLFFGDVHHPAQFHKQKLCMHRASMQSYRAVLASLGHEAVYLEHRPGRSGGLTEYLQHFVLNGGKRLLTADPHDDLVRRRLFRAASALKVQVTVLDTPMFLNSVEENTAWRRTKKRWFMADFYTYQRRKLDVLMDGDAPVGGQWSFDHENRKKVPRALLQHVPKWPDIESTVAAKKAVAHVNAKYPSNPGRLDRCLSWALRSNGSAGDASSSRSTAS